MATKSVVKVLDELPKELKENGDESAGYLELTPEEAEELAGGWDGACNNNYTCPTTNTGCPQKA